ncbi:MAG: hypothetical protein ACP5HG_10610 [Anaerolineae bacterium]
MKHRAYVLAALVLVLVAVPVAVWASGPGEIATIRRAMSQYHLLKVAEADGFEPLFECIADPAQGAMGWHYIRGDRFNDQLSLEEPEVLIYDFEPNGEAKLVAVEYIIPAAAWAGAEPPEFLGHELKYKTTVGPHGADEGVTPYYELHVWTWRRNPSGMFADWNPRVSCP